MPTFRVYTVEHIERAADYTLDITQQEVVSAMHLVGNDINTWQNHVDDYVSLNWSKLEPRAIQNNTDDNVCDIDIESVEPEEEPA